MHRTHDNTFCIFIICDIAVSDNSVRHLDNRDIDYCFPKDRAKERRRVRGRTLRDVRADDKPIDGQRRDENADVHDAGCTANPRFRTSKTL